MHPELWTVPGTAWTIPTYGFCMAAGFGVAIWLAVFRAKKSQADPGVITSLAAIGGVAGILGARGMHLIHYYGDKLKAGEMSPSEIVATMAGGGEVLGGIVLATIAVVIFLLATKRSIRQYIDIMFPPMILAMAIGRIGCLMFGCCWGQVCATDAGEKGTAWAVQFPYGAPAYLMQWHEGTLKVPDELIYQSPQRPRPEPIPRDILWNASLEDEALTEYVALFERATAMKAESPDDPALAGLAKTLRPMANELPGKNRLQKEQLMRAAVQVHRVAQADQSDFSTALEKIRTIARSQKSQWVHPTQVYDLVGLSLMFMVLSVLFYRRKRHGVVISWTLILYGVNRFSLEMLRGDNPHDVIGLTISQFMSLVILAIGLVYLALVMKVLPAQSARVETMPQE